MLGLLSKNSRKVPLELLNEHQEGQPHSQIAPKPTAPPHGQLEETPLAELVKLLDWHDYGSRDERKRHRGAPEKTREKHRKSEKKRRGELASAIADIDALMPNTLSTRRSKLATVTQAADYFQRVQDVACTLIRENRRLAASLTEVGSSAPTSKQSSSQPQEYVILTFALTLADVFRVARLLIIITFLVWVFVGVPTPWSGGPTTVAFSSRSVLDMSVDTSSKPSFSPAVIEKLILVTCAFIVLWIGTLIYDTPRVPTQDLHTADLLLMEASQAFELNSNWVRSRSTKCFFFSSISSCRSLLMQSLPKQCIYYVSHYHQVYLVRSCYCSCK